MSQVKINERVIPITTILMRAETKGEVEISAHTINTMVELMCQSGIDVYIRTPVTINRELDFTDGPHYYTVRARLALDGKGEVHGGAPIRTANHVVTIRGFQNDHKE